ncbi:hypothetical protein GQ42DRAFT_162174 [Ramicandelaber brevisporus]|nr:hypothetical protein GQ42DRAFT_162174 [Ramicandelaber brevisporus]
MNNGRPPVIKPKFAPGAFGASSGSSNGSGNVNGNSISNGSGLDDLLGTGSFASPAPKSSTLNTNANANANTASQTSLLSSLDPLGRTASPSVNMSMSSPSPAYRSPALNNSLKPSSSTASLNKSASTAASASTTDPFSELFNIGSSSSNRNMTLEEKRKQQSSLSSNSPANKASDNSLWDFDALTSTASAKPATTSARTTAINQPLQPVQLAQPAGTVQMSSKPASALEDFADFESAFGNGSDTKSTPLQPKQKALQPIAKTVRFNDNNDDDVEDLNVFEDLAEPAKPALPPRRPSSSATFAMSSSVSRSSPTQQEAIEQMVDMGFDRDSAKVALEMTRSGNNVEAAVRLLLEQGEQASSISKRQQHGHPSFHDAFSYTSPPSLPPRSNTMSSSDIDGSDAQGGDLSRQIQERANQAMSSAKVIGASLFSKASQLVQQGRKKFEEYNSTAGMQQEIPWRVTRNRMQTKYDSDSDTESQPAPSRWRRPTPATSSSPSTSATTPSSATSVGAGAESKPYRDESSSDDDSGPVQVQTPPRQRPPATLQASAPSSAHQTADLLGQETEAVRGRLANINIKPESDFANGSSSSSSTDAFASLGAPPSHPKRAPAKPANRPSAQVAASTVSSSASVSTYASKPKKRVDIKPLSEDVLTKCITHKRDGTAHFKLGRYDEATAEYTRALDILPPVHPLRLPLLANRASCSLKTGEYRRTIEDCTELLLLASRDFGGCESGGSSYTFRTSTSTSSLKSPSLWSQFTQTDEDVIERETQALAGTEVVMVADQMAKAYQRRAMAHEGLEKLSDALADWQKCSKTPGLQDGLRRLASDGIRRCEQALRPKPPVPPRPSAKPKATPPPKPPSSTKPKPESVLAALSGSANDGDDLAASSKRVAEMREQEIKAQKEDDERHEMRDDVESRVLAWRKGKETNLRALISSADRVLWAECAWKPVGLHELITPAQVKKAYMKAIVKVHPDRLSQDETVEHRMIAALVFAALNEAWDSFRSENGL